MRHGEPKPTVDGKTRVVAGIFVESWLDRLTNAADHIGSGFAAYKAVEDLARAVDRTSTFRGNAWADACQHLERDPVAARDRFTARPQPI